eukprot:SAG31_NODE_5715_length_2366_cov_1.956771_1_plen_634_part_00
MQPSVMGPACAWLRGLILEIIAMSVHVRTESHYSGQQHQHLWVLPTGQDPASQNLESEANRFPRSSHPVDGVFETLHMALAAAAGLHPSATIHLLAGKHKLERTLELDRRHSQISIIGHGTAVLTGGLTVGTAQPRAPDGGHNISSWTKANPARCNGCGSHVWKAAIPRELDSRQFYVNGVRANRSWAALPAGSTKQNISLTVPGTTPISWRHNTSAIELVYRGGASAGSEWQESRCPVASISNSTQNSSTHDFALPFQRCAADYCRAAACPATDPRDHEILNKSGPNGQFVCAASAPVCVGYVFNSHMGTCMANSSNLTGTTRIEIVQPCVTNGNNKIKGTQPLRVPAFVENVFELLGSASHGHPGDFYIDSGEGDVYYVPHAEETPEAVVGVVPTLETLVNGTDVVGVSFTNLIFEYATWMRPSTAVGFVDVQAGYCLACAVGEEQGCLQDPGDSPEHPPTAALKFYETPAAVTFAGSHNITIDGCTFRHLGSNGVGFIDASQNNTVRHSMFTDISASAVVIGTRGDPTLRQADPALQERGNTVADCTIHAVAREYRGHPGLLVGFSHGTTLIHNEIYNIPYSAISIGWGWSSWPYTWEGANAVVGNHIHHHMQVNVIVLGFGFLFFQTSS